jgi:hypothetical protein
MSTFQRLASKVRESKNIGSGIVDVYEPDWFAYGIMMKFLHGIFQPRVTQNTEGSPNHK